MVRNSFKTFQVENFKCEVLNQTSDSVVEIGKRREKYRGQKGSFCAGNLQKNLAIRSKLGKKNSPAAVLVERG